MSGHKPWSEIKREVPSTTEGRALHRQIDRQVAIRERPVWHDAVDAAIAEARAAALAEVRAALEAAEEIQSYGSNDDTRDRLLMWVRKDAILDALAGEQP